MGEIVDELLFLSGNVLELQDLGLHLLGHEIEIVGHAGHLVLSLDRKPALVISLRYPGGSA